MPILAINQTELAVACARACSSSVPNELVARSALALYRNVTLLRKADVERCNRPLDPQEEENYAEAWQRAKAYAKQLHATVDESSYMLRFSTGARVVL